LSVNPFLIEISIKEPKTNYIVLISVGIIVFFCIICGVIIFLVSRKAAENARRRQEIFRLRALANRRYEDGTSSSENNNPSSSSESEENIQEKNKKIIEKLLKTTLAPMKYNSFLGIHDGNPSVVCTICLEEFKVDISKVSITPCQHVFHFDCLSNWLTNNLLNPKCPNCNLNLIQEKNECICSQGLYDIPEMECNVIRSHQSRTLNINRRINNIETISGNTVSLDTAENRLMTRNDNNRGRDRNSIVTTASINNLCTSQDDNNAKSQNTANSDNKKKEEEVIVIESINNNEN
jgi:hypothetical protein